MKLRRPATHLAALCAFCLCAGTGFGQSPASPPAPSAKTNPLSGMALEVLHTTRERPLFAASRRLPPPIVAEAPNPIDTTPEPEKPDVTLVGIIYGAGLKIAVFIGESDKPLIRARLGESVHGWTLYDVDRTTATLEKAQEQVKLELKLAVHNADITVTPQESSAPLRGTPVGPIKPYATAGRER